MKQNKMKQNKNNIKKEIKYNENHAGVRVIFLGFLRHFQYEIVKT